MEILSAINGFIEKYSYIFTFLGFTIGIVGTIAGFYNWRMKKYIIELRESVIAAHFQNIRNFKMNLNSGNISDSIKQEFLLLYRQFLEMLTVIMSPSKEEIKQWLNDGYIDKSDYEVLIKMKLR